MPCDLPHAKEDCMLEKALVLCDVCVEVARKRSFLAMLNQVGYEIKKVDENDQSSAFVVAKASWAKQDIPGLAGIPISQEWKNGCNYPQWIDRHKDEEVIEKNRDGSIASKFYFRNGQMHGECLRYYHNGQVYEKSVYNNGKRNGKCYWWSENGQQVLIASYVNDIGEGDFLFYHSNGQLSHKLVYHNGKRNGECCWWFQNGQICEKSFFKDDRLNGVSCHWFENGRKRMTAIYKNDKRHGEYVEWNEDGTIKEFMLDTGKD